MGATTEIHELLHLLGSVMTSAPNSNGFGHCKDDVDIMCYSEGGVQTYVRCASQFELLDCGADDYFNARPQVGTYLSTHWNTANSRFLGSPRGRGLRSLPALASEDSVGPAGEETPGSGGTLAGQPIRAGECLTKRRDLVMSCPPPRPVSREAVQMGRPQFSRTGRRLSPLAASFGLLGMLGLLVLPTSQVGDTQSTAAPSATSALAPIASQPAAAQAPVSDDGPTGVALEGYSAAVPAALRLPTLPSRSRFRPHQVPRR